MSAGMFVCMCVKMRECERERDSAVGERERELVTNLKVIRNAKKYMHACLTCVVAMTTTTADTNKQYR